MIKLLAVVGENAIHSKAVSVCKGFQGKIVKLLEKKFMTVSNLQLSHGANPMKNVIRIEDVFVINKPNKPLVLIKKPKYLSPYLTPVPLLSIVFKLNLNVPIKGNALS